MSAGEMQQALARLVLDSAFRRLFGLEPDVTLAHYSLSEEERSALKGLDRRSLEVFARHVRGRRAALLPTHLPLLHAIVPRERIQRLFDRFHDIHPPPGDPSRLVDAIRFARFVEEALGADEEAPTWWADVVRYERVLLTMAERRHASLGPRVADDVVVEEFGCDVIELARSIRAGHPSPSSRRQGIAFRCDDGGRPRSYHLNPASFALLTACTGERAVAELVEVCEERLGIPDLDREVRDMIGTLCEKGLLRA